MTMDGSDHMKVAHIGAGSYVFAPMVVNDLFAKARLDGIEMAFCDVNLGMARLMAGVAGKVAEGCGLRLRATATDDRVEAVRGAGYVITSVAAEGVRRWQVDHAICVEEGIPEILGECGALGGISYGLRNSALLLAICRDMEALCPDALLLNVSNPLTKVQTAVSRYTGIRTLGFCNAAQGGAEGNEIVAGYLGRNFRDVRVMTAGINHFSWVLEVSDAGGGGDLLPELAARVGERAGGGSPHAARYLGVYRRYGAFPGAPGHHEEFMAPADGAGSAGRNPFHGSAEERERRIGELRSIADGTVRHGDSEAFTKGSWEHPGLVIAALHKGETLGLPMVNVANRGCLPQLPEGAIVEVPAVVSGGAVRPSTGLRLPEAAAEASANQLEVAGLIAEAAAKGEAGPAHAAVDADDAIEPRKKGAAHRALDRMIEAHRDLMPQFK